MAQGGTINADGKGYGGGLGPGAGRSSPAARSAAAAPVMAGMAGRARPSMAAGCLTVQFSSRRCWGAAAALVTVARGRRWREHQAGRRGHLARGRQRVRQRRQRHQRALRWRFGGQHLAERPEPSPGPACFRPTAARVSLRRAAAAAGGRISLQYASASLSPARLSARGGNGYARGGAGTIYTRANSQSTGQVLVDNGGKAGTNTPLATRRSL